LKRVIPENLIKDDSIINAILDSCVFNQVNHFTARSTVLFQGRVMSAQKCDQVEQVAPVAGLQVNNLTKIQLIRKFQRTEGNFDCCATAYNRVCKQFECLWRDECLKLVNDEALLQDDHD
jgi:hypothetical protein